jgi:IS1 family transposase
VRKKPKGQLTLQLDEMWSFVKKKRKKQWIWIALDQNTREIVGLYIGDRSKKSAEKLWQSLSPVYRQCAICYTNFWESSSEVLPFKRHRPVGKESGKTSYIERLNNTLRQRISRLVRKTFSFSKKLPNHIGAIFNFVHHYNSCIRKRYHYCA